MAANSNIDEDTHKVGICDENISNQTFTSTLVSSNTRLADSSPTCVDISNNLAQNRHQNLKLLSVFNSAVSYALLATTFNALSFGILFARQSTKQHSTCRVVPARQTKTVRTPLLLLISSIILLSYSTTTTLNTVQATLTGSSLGTAGQGIKIVLPDQSGIRPELDNSNDDDDESNKSNARSDSDYALDSKNTAEFISRLRSSGGGGDAEQVLAEFQHQNQPQSNSYDEAQTLASRFQKRKFLARDQWHSSPLGKIFQPNNENVRMKRAAMIMPVETYGAASSGGVVASLLSGRRANKNEPIGYPGCGIQHYKPNYIMQATSADARDVGSAAAADVALRSAPTTAATALSRARIVSKRRVEAKQNSWPWQADLFFYRTMPDGTKQRAHLCGATLIDRWHVVTAAHCNISRLAQPLFGEVPSEYYVRLGQHKRSAATVDHVQEIRVKHWRDHEMFNDSVTYAKTGEMQFFLFNDIAFLTLERPATLSPEVYPICLDFNEQPVFDVGATCYASGWSLDEFDYEKWLRGDYSDVLNESKSKIADTDYCRKHHGGFNETVTLCTKYAQGHYSCHGDSGGPLQCESNGRFFLVGIVSYDVATSCRETGMTFFSRVSGLQTWIEARLVEDMLSL